MQVKLLLVTYLNGGLHAVYIGKPPARISNFWMVQFLKTESKPNLGFPHISTENETCNLLTPGGRLNLCATTSSQVEALKGTLQPKKWISHIYWTKFTPLLCKKTIFKVFILEGAEYQLLRDLFYDSMLRKSIEVFYTTITSMLHY